MNGSVPPAHQETLCRSVAQASKVANQIRSDDRIKDSLFVAAHSQGVHKYRKYPAKMIYQKSKVKNHVQNYTLDHDFPDMMS